MSVLTDVKPASRAIGAIGASDPQSTPQAVVLRAGEQLAYAERSTVVPQTAAVATKVERADLSRVSAWTERKLDFDDTPLVEAVAEANRYSTVRIELRTTASLEDVRMSGMFEAGKNEAFAQALHAHLDLVVQRVDKDRIILTQP